LEAIALILTKFSDEVIAAQLALVFFASSVALYWLVVRKKKKESAEWVPAALVRAYLDKVRADEQEVRFKLFGEAPSGVVSTQAPLAAALSTVTTVTDPALLKEVDALRTQLASSDQRAIEFDRMVNALKAEKAALEEKLKAAPAAGAPVAAGPSPEALKELEDLKARLQEYEVIEDDLANLKKFQKENEQLRQKVETYEKGGAVATTVLADAPAPEAQTVVSADKAAAPTMTLVSGGAASAAPAESVTAAAPAAAVEAPAAVAAVAEAAPVAAAAAEANTNVLQEVNPTASAPADAAAPAADGAAAPAAVAEAAPEKSAKQKEEELLSEFEKMLAS
jgi:hypothetical protein